MRALLKNVLKIAGPRLARNRIARDLFFLTARDFTPFLSSDAGQYRYHVSTADRTVGREVFLTGGFDASCIERIFNILRLVGYGGFQGKLFADIGANIGTTSIPVVTEQGFAGGIAFEPEPVNFALLRQNVADNRLDDRIKCINVALSNREGRSEMELCTVNLGDHRLRPSGLAAEDGIYHEMSRPVVSVATTTFDALVDLGSVSLEALGVVWIDTQGHEGHVLDGARKLLRADVPVVVEFWPYALSRACGLEVFESLVQEHYTHFIDVRATEELTTSAVQPVSRLPKLKDRYLGPALTDLVLLK